MKHIKYIAHANATEHIKYIALANEQVQMQCGLTFPTELRQCSSFLLLIINEIMRCEGF
jgi:hypothetical protein